MIELTRKEEQILLAIHFLKDEASLLNIRERIRKYTGKNYSVGTIYAPLNRLYINGFLESSMEKIADSKKPVKYYRLSEDGYIALVHLKKFTDEMWHGFVNPLLEK